METPANVLNLRIGGDTGKFRPEVIDRATLMIRAVLEAASLHGSWLYMVTGPANSLQNPSQYSMEVRGASEVLTTMIHVVVRASLGSGGALIGMLKLPPEAHSRQLMTDLQPYVDIFNGSGWQGVLVPEVRQASCFVGKPPVTTVLKPAKRTVRELDDEDLKPPVRVVLLDGPTYLARERERTLPRPAAALPNPYPTVAPARAAVFPVRPERVRKVLPAQPRSGNGVARPLPKFPPIGSPAPAVIEEAAMPDPKTEHADKLAEFLRQVLAQDDVANGVFRGKGITRFSQPLFPNAAKLWQRTGVLGGLTSLHWIRRVGHGEYQVEQAFVTKYGLAISLTPRDRIARGDKKKATKGPKLNGHAHNGDGLQVLLDQAATLNARIQEVVKREERELEASLAEAQAAVVRAQELVVERQAALDALKARLAPLLTPHGATATALPAARS